MGRLRLLLWVTCAIASPAIAAADDAAQPWAVGVTDDQKQQARALLDKGNTLFVDNNFNEALKAYSEAIAIWDHPAIRFNMVRCLIQLDRIVEASDNLEKALKYGAAPLEEGVFKEAQAYQKLLAQQIGTVEIDCKQDGVAVTLDGKALATCPASKSLRVEPGTHQLVGTKRGLLTSTETITVFGGKTTKAIVKLDPPAKGAKIVHRWPGYVPFIAFGAGAALLGGGALLQLNASQQMETYDTRLDAECTRGCDPNNLPAEIEDIRKGAERKNAIGVTLLVAGGAGVVTGAVLMYLNRGRTVYPESITPLPGGGAAVMWGGKF